MLYILATLLLKNVLIVVSVIIIKLVAIGKTTVLLSCFEAKV